jgi:hypothetical protein
VLALDPVSFKLKPIVRFSLYVAAATMMESPDEARATACPMLLHAIDAKVQLLLSLPLTPFTYPWYWPERLE